MPIGKIKEFDVQKDDWRLYIERVEQYFVVNEVTSTRQVPTLITVMGSESYELLVNLCTPVKPKDKTFQEIVDIMEKHLQPKPSELAERYKFRQRTQKNNEGISEYVAVLKKMSKSCEFGTWLEQSLRDQLVCGIRSETIRQRLFAETKLDFAKAYTIAVSLEAAEKNAATVEGHRRLPDEPTTAECQAITSGTGRSRASCTVKTARSYGGGAMREVVSQGAWRPRGARAPSASAPARSGERAQRQQACGVCGGAHDASTCKFRRYSCRVCNRLGHLRRVCPNIAEQHFTEERDRVSDSEESEEVIAIDFNKLSLRDCKPILIPIIVDGKLINMECDTGSAVSCISQDMYQRHFHNLNISVCNLILRYYTGEVIRPIGVIQPRVRYDNKSKTLDLYVIQNGKTALLGRQWLAELNIQLPNFKSSTLNALNSESLLSDLSSRFCDVFAEGLGRYTGGPVSIYVREGARPVFLRARPLAYALRAPVERALEQHVRDGILTPVERSDWATPIVPVVKKDGSIRICADYKLTLNKVLEIDRYPLPRVEDLLVRLNGGLRFSKIDLSQAYAQLELDDSKKYTVINTHKGLFIYNRLVYGLASSPGIFQRRLEEMFADLPSVGVFLDDIIITGKTTSEHVDNLYRVFERLQKYGLRVKKEKCDFFTESVSYLGHVISKDGVHTCPNKTKAISKTPSPCNLSELRSFIGMVMYYAKFVPNISTLLAPLYRLLKSNVKYVWSDECQQAFEVLKAKLVSSEVLVHYSEELPLILTADASTVGVGAVLSHVTPTGERPIAYASRSLTSAERHYAQIDREALAIIFGIRKFHQYLYGRHFVLRTDHKPLTYILGDKVGIPVMAASRLQRWAVLLSGYQYAIEYVTSKRNCADALSRLPPGGRGRDTDRVVREVTYSNFVEDFLPVSNDDVRKATAKDVNLSRVKVYIESGWPSFCPEEIINPYFNRRNELYLDNGCIMWGYRMVIPESLQSLVLKQLHISHMGIVKTKSLARSYVWWPRIDHDVEEQCRACDTCAHEASAPPRAPPQPWPYAPQPWTRLHIDFLGPYKGLSYLILIDSTSKWIEAFDMRQKTATGVIKTLRTTFARFGLPVELVSDQGPPFTSSEFESFLKNNGIKQTFSPVYHPSSNGAAENAVKLCKRAIKKALRDNVDVDAALQTFLLTYRNSLHSTTGETPARLLQKRTLRSRLDLLRSHYGVEERVGRAQQNQSKLAGGVNRRFESGEPIWARGYGTQDKWIKGKIIDNEGSRRCIVVNDNGQFFKRHIDQIRRRSRLSDVPFSEEPLENRGEDAVSCDPVEKAVVDGIGESGVATRKVDNSTVAEPPARDQTENAQSTSIVECSAPETSHASQQPERRYPKRVCKPVARYGFEID